MVTLCGVSQPFMSWSNLSSLVWPPGFHYWTPPTCAPEYAQLGLQASCAEFSSSFLLSLFLWLKYYLPFFLTYMELSIKPDQIAFCHMNSFILKVLGIDHKDSNMSSMCPMVSMLGLYKIIPNSVYRAVKRNVESNNKQKQDSLVNFNIVILLIWK